MPTYLLYVMSAKSKFAAPYTCSISIIQIKVSQAQHPLVWKDQRRHYQMEMLLIGSLCKDGLVGIQRSQSQPRILVHIHVDIVHHFEFIKITPSLPNFPPCSFGKCHTPTFYLPFFQ